jgi:hypothetical protein
MFFHISNRPQENYPCQWQLGSFAIGTDDGWKHLTIGPVQILYKGYADSGLLESLLGRVIFQSIPHLTGNFCALVVVNDTLTIQTDRYRGFPIYIGHRDINNLVAADRVAWTDSLVTVNADMTVIENNFDLIGNIDTTEIDFQQAVDQVHGILFAKVRKFLSHNTLPLKVFLSGGVDTMLVYSFLMAAGAKFELLDHDHLTHDYFWRTNSHLITRNWAYCQTHHWKESCVLASGTPGDEFMLRNPVSGNLYLRHIGKTVNELIQPEHMHYAYVNQEKNQQLLNGNQPPLCDSKQELHYRLCNTVVNDWQHWHLGTTLHWTPLRDLEIFKLILRLPPEYSTAQILNSEFSKALIERNLPGGTKLLSDQKNAGSVLKNLNGLFHGR